MSDRNEFARDIFIADNWSNSEAANEWWHALEDGNAIYAYNIADRLIANGYEKVAKP